MRRGVTLCLLFLMCLLAAGPDAVAADAPSPAAAASTPASGQRFEIREYRVLGNSLLSERQIEALLYSRLGPDKTLEDVEAARTALETAYHALGFATVFVDIPPQSVDEGIVRLHVTEGKINARTISGAHYFSERQILSELPATQPGTAPNLNALQDQLNAVNTQSADRSVVPVLKAGPTPGTTDVALKVDDRLPLHGSLELDDQYTPDTKPLRAVYALSYDNLFNALDSLSLQYVSSPQKWNEVGVLNAGFAFAPIGAGIRPSLSFTNSSSNVATTGTLGVLGAGQVFSARMSFPVLQIPGDLQSVTAGLDYKHFRNTISLAATSSQSAGIQIEPISYVNASVAYLGIWQWMAGAAAQTGTLSLTADFGPRGFANGAQEFSNSRFNARGNYAYLHLETSLVSHLPAQWQVIVRGGGQFALDPLVEYEQYSVTGASGVRGYLEAESLGDTALKGSLQLQSPMLTHHGFQIGDAFVFFDAARSHLIDALAGETQEVGLRSFGAGVDLLPGHKVTGSLTWADPLVPGPRTDAHASRVLFDFKGSF